MNNHETLMQGLTVQHLWFTLMAQESIVFGDQPGSALRGGLYQALQEHFCSAPMAQHDTDHVQHCPVCWLLAAEDHQATRGANPQRPMTIEPPPAFASFADGETFGFGLTLIGQAQNLLPYLLRAVQKLGDRGVSKGRGRFRLVQISETNPLLDVERPLLDRNCVKQPTLQITPARISEHAAQFTEAYVVLKLLTPLRLTANKQLVKVPDPVAFVARLIERCQQLSEHYAETDEPAARDDWYTTFHHLTSAAQELTIGLDMTEWVEAWSGSRRQQRYTPISGLAGYVRWDGPVQPLIPWLLWGQSLHVGKSTVKGNGWYRVST